MNGDVNYWKIHPQASFALKWVGFLFGYCIDWWNFFLIQVENVPFELQIYST